MLSASTHRLSSRLFPPHRQLRVSPKLSLSALDENDGLSGTNDQNANNDSEKNIDRSFKKIGGRVVRQSNMAPDTDEDTKPPRKRRWGFIAVPILAVLLMFNVLFGAGGGGGSNYVYYQSSVYESRVVMPDGRIDTTRKESIRSNVPALLEGKQSRDGDVSSFSSGDLRDQADDAFDMEIDTLMRFERGFQRALLDDVDF